MSDDWNDVTDVQTDVNKNQWADEDADEGDLDAWDVDEEEVKRKKAEAQAKVRAEQEAKEAAKRKKEEEKKAKEEALKASLREYTKAELEEMARKRDANLAAALLGVEPLSAADVPGPGERDLGSDIADGAVAVEVSRGGTSVEDYPLTEDAHFEKLAAILAKRLTSLQMNAKNSTRVLSFLKKVSSDCCDVMRVDDVSELKRIVTAKHNEATMKQKAIQKGPKKTVAATGGRKTVVTSTIKASASTSGSRNLYSADLDGGDDDGGADDDFM